MALIHPLTIAGCMLTLSVPASAEVYRVANADKPAEFLDLDCAQDPTGRNFGWVASNCRLAGAAAAPVSKVTVHGWNPEKKEEIVGKRKD
jgi:hypothetical protein